MHPELATSDRELGQAVLAWLAATGCVDMARVFLAGHSQGGGMAADLACELSDRFAGVALVSGEYLRFPCPSAHPIPVVAFHALDDEILPFEGGTVSGAPSNYPNVLPVENVLAQWAAHDRCASEPETTALREGVVRLAWQKCSAPVVLYRLPSGGHNWAAIATDTLWAFFAGVPSLR